jgi:hypothetical protein
LLIFIFFEYVFNLSIVIINKLFSKLAFIVSKSKFSGNMIFLSNFHQKHSEFFNSKSGVKISGFCLNHLIINIFFSKARSISSSSTHAIGAKIIICSEDSKISRAT